MHQNALSAFSALKIAIFRNSHTQVQKMHRVAPPGMKPQKFGFANEPGVKQNFFALIWTGIFQVGKFSGGGRQVCSVHRSVIYFPLLEVKLRKKKRLYLSLLLDPKVELVMVATGSPAQCSPIALKTLGIGKTVVCQKALCGTSQVQALRIVEASKYYPSLLSITGFTLRDSWFKNQPQKHINFNWKRMEN